MLYFVLLSGKVVGVKKRGETVRVGQRRGAWIQLEATTEVRVLTQQQEKNKQRAMNEKNPRFWMQVEMVEERSWRLYNHVM